MSEPRPRRAAVGAWVVYDVANTTFWTGVVGLAFPLRLVKELSGDDATLGYTLSATMVVVMLLAPILGAISDQTGRRMPLLVATTLVCVCATLLLGNGGLLVSLCLFALALGSMELGVILYNSLLAEVSTQHNRGMVSGLGTGIGYVGSFIAVGVALVFTQLFTEPSRYIFVFRAVAVLFLLFALPIFFLLKERAIDGLPSTGLGKVSRAFSQLIGDLRSLQRFPGLRQFLTARFFYGMGINTAVAFAVVYASQTVGLGDREIQMVLLGGISIAIPSGVLWGALVDRIGPRRVLSFSLLLWIGVLLFAIAIPELSLSTHLYWVVGCFTGVAMSGGWTADRPYMLSLIPPQYLGEFFGLHGMVSKLGRVVGPFMWAFVSVTLGLGQTTAVLSLVVCLAVSCIVLAKVGAPVVSRSADLVE